MITVHAKMDMRSENNRCALLVFALATASLFSSCGGRDALKGYEWLEGKWVDEGYLYKGYDHDYHSVIITKNYFQSAASLTDDEMIIDPASKPKKKLSIETTKEGWLNGIKSFHDYYIDEERQQIFWLYDFDIKHYMTKVSDGGSSPGASARNGAQFKNRKRSTKGWTERMNANNGLLVCRSNYRSRFSPRYNYYAFLPNPDSKDGCRGVMMVIMMQYNKEVQSFTVFYPEFSATYEVRDGKVHFTNCYEWHFSNFEKGRRKRIPDDFDGTWSVNEGVLKMDTKMYDAQWSRWLDATIVEEDMHEFRVDRLRDEFARLARYD